MTYCSDCIHHKVCGNEGVDDVSMTFCADKQTKDVVPVEEINEKYWDYVNGRVTNNRMNEEEAKLEAFTDFLNDIEQVAQKHGWNIGLYKNLSDDKEFKRVEITFIPALGYDSQFRKF